jgi:hypothetical protein
MDAYSSTIIDAVAKVKTAVVKIETHIKQDNKTTGSRNGLRIFILFRWIFIYK